MLCRVRSTMAWAQGRRGDVPGDDGHSCRGVSSVVSVHHNALLVLLLLYLLLRLLWEPR